MAPRVLIVDYRMGNLRSVANAFGALGMPYFVMAAALGAWLLVGVVRVMRADDFVKPAWSVYKFSLLYLALLFGAMVVDRVMA